MAAPIRITVVTMVFPPEQGAAPSRMYKLCRELVENGFEVEVLTAMPNYPTGRIFPEYRGRVSSVEQMDGMTVRRHWVYASNAKSAVRRISSMLSFSATLYRSWFRLRRRWQPEIVLVQTPPFTAGLAGVRIGRTVGAKVVLNVSDLWPLSALELGAIKPGNLYNRLVQQEQRMYRGADVIIGQSQETIDYIRADHPNKAYFLYRNLDQPSPYRESGAPYREDGLRVVYAGLLGVAQGVLRICREVDFRSLNTEFHIYGAGNELEQIQAYIAAHPEANISYHGSVPKSEIPGVLAQAHATIIPLTDPIRGAFPSKVFMAVSAGLPILFAGEGEGARVVEEMELGFVSPPGDSAALEANLRRLRSLGPEAYGQLRTNCIEASKREFDFKRQANQLIEFLHEVAGR